VVGAGRPRCGAAVFGSYPSPAGGGLAGRLWPCTVGYGRISVFGLYFWTEQTVFVQGVRIKAGFGFDLCRRCTGCQRVSASGGEWQFQGARFPWPVLVVPPCLDFLARCLRVRSVVGEGVGVRGRPPRLVAGRVTGRKAFGTAGGFATSGGFGTGFGAGFATGFGAGGLSGGWRPGWRICSGPMVWGTRGVRRRGGGWVMVRASTRGELCEMTLRRGHCCRGCSSLHSGQKGFM
jgi:hypothetical protein